MFAQVVTFGKAVGTHGAIVLGSQLLKQFLINFCKSCLYTTALPLHMLVAIKCAYERVPLMDQERHHLRTLINHCREQLGPLSETAIQPVHVPGNNKAQQLSKYLANKGFNALPITSPTVQNGREMLRICLHAFNRENELLSLLHSIIQWREHHA